MPACEGHFAGASHVQLYYAGWHPAGSGRRGHVDLWIDYIADLDAFIHLVRQQEPGVPVFLPGHSLGGLITLDYALGRPDCAPGVVAISPAVAVTVPAYQLALARPLARIIPTASIHAKPDFRTLTRDHVAIARLAADHMAHGTLSIGLGRGVSEAAARVNARASCTDRLTTWVRKPYLATWRAGWSGS